MARNYKELQAKMDPASRGDNKQRVREELQRMALEQLRNAKQLTQTDMAEILDVPQSSISRIEQRADMYLSTLRNYIHAMGGVLQIRAIFPDVDAVVIDRFGDYEYQPYEVSVRAEGSGKYRLLAQPRGQGVPFTKAALKASALMKTMRALHLPESQISGIKADLDAGGRECVVAGHFGARRIFTVPELVAAGFEAASTE